VAECNNVSTCVGFCKCVLSLFIHNFICLCTSTFISAAEGEVVTVVADPGDGWVSLCFCCGYFFLMFSFSICDLVMSLGGYHQRSRREGACAKELHDRIDVCLLALVHLLAWILGEG
jgi:hypothetical protein